MACVFPQWPRIEPTTPVLEAWRLNKWTTREVPQFLLNFTWRNLLPSAILPFSYEHLAVSSVMLECCCAKPFLSWCRTWCDFFQNLDFSKWFAWLKHIYQCLITELLFHNVLLLNPVFPSRTWWVFFFCSFILYEKNFIFTLLDLRLSDSAFIASSFSHV